MLALRVSSFHPICRYLGDSCGSDSYLGYGKVNGVLEKCDNYTAIETYNREDRKAYEKYKCEHLRC